MAEGNADEFESWLERLGVTAFEPTQPGSEPGTQDGAAVQAQPGAEATPTKANATAIGTAVEAGKEDSPTPGSAPEPGQSIPGNDANYAQAGGVGVRLVPVTDRQLPPVKNLELPKVDDPVVDILSDSSVQRMKRSKVLASPKYINNGIKDLMAQPDVWSLKVDKMHLAYSDGRMVVVVMKSIRMGSAPPAEVFELKGGSIYPINDKGEILYDDDNTPNIILCAQWIYKEIARRAQDREDLARIVAAFASDVAGLGGVAGMAHGVGGEHGGPTGRGGRNPARGGGSEPEGSPAAGKPPRGGGGADEPIGAGGAGKPKGGAGGSTPPGDGAGGSPPPGTPGKPAPSGRSPSGTLVEHPPPMPRPQPAPKVVNVPPKTQSANPPVLEVDVVASFRKDPESIVHSLSTDWHQKVWQNLGNKGPAPVAFRIGNGVRVDVQRWPRAKLGEIGLKLRDKPLTANVKPGGGSKAPPSEFELAKTGEPLQPSSEELAKTPPAPPPSAQKPVPAAPAKAPSGNAGKGTAGSGPAPATKVQGIEVSPERVQKFAATGGEVYRSTSSEKHAQAWNLLRQRQGLPPSDPPVAFMVDKKMFVDVSRWPKDVPLPDFRLPTGGPKVKPSTSN